jgi:hypothetical protein
VSYPKIKEIPANVLNKEGEMGIWCL